MKPVIKDQRTLEQNARYQAMTRELSVHCKMEHWKLKELCKWQLGFTVDRHGITMLLSTSEYTVSEMYGLMWEIKSWAHTDLDYLFFDERGLLGAE